MSDAESLRNQYNSILLEIEKAKAQLQQARAAQDPTTACTAGLNHCQQAQKLLLTFGSNSKTVFGQEGETYRKQYAECKQQIETTKTQLNQTQDNAMSANVMVSDLKNQMVLQNQQDETRIQMETALANLRVGEDMGKDANAELIDQNDHMLKMTKQTERIDVGLQKGQKLADLIKCTEQKHLYAQSILVSTMLALAIAAVVIRLIM